MKEKSSGQWRLFCPFVFGKRMKRIQMPVQRSTRLHEQPTQMACQKKATVFLQGVVFQHTSLAETFVTIAALVRFSEVHRHMSAKVIRSLRREITLGALQFRFAARPRDICLINIGRCWRGLIIHRIMLISVAQQQTLQCKIAVFYPLAKYKRTRNTYDHLLLHRGRRSRLGILKTLIIIITHPVNRHQGTLPKFKALNLYNMNNFFNRHSAYTLKFGK